MHEIYLFPHRRRPNVPKEANGTDRPRDLLDFPALRTDIDLD
jgi:hypothetical protein